VGFWNGAHYVNPDVEVINTYHPGSVDQCFADPEFGAETASEQIAQGADVIFGAGGLTGNGALIAACNHGVRVIGVDVDQYESLPEIQNCIVSSATKDLTHSVAQLIVSVDDGTFQGGDVFGNVVLAPFHNFEDSITPEMRDTITQIVQQIESGEINPCDPYDDSNPDTFCVPVAP
jgi:basic membrane protein A